MHVRLRCGSLSITTSVSLLANEFDVRSVLHKAVNQICVIHEAMNIKDCFENVNIKEHHANVVSIRKYN